MIDSGQFMEGDEEPGEERSQSEVMRFV